MALRIARFFLSILVFFAPCFAYAATVYLDPQEGTYHPGDTFVVNVRLDTNGDCVNVISADIGYPAQLRASAVSQGESILTLWTEEPKIDAQNGKIHFIGGVPGGYCGRIPGDPGYANIVLKMIFTVPQGTSAGAIPPITVLPSTQVLLADGRGTPATVLDGKAEFTVATGTGTVINEWQDDINGDDTPPEEFAIDLHHDPSTVGGKYFIVFQTTDKQSGVNHYEVMERDRDRPQFMRNTRTTPVWKRAVSPFVLADQTLESTIIVRAIDNAGKIREEVLDPNQQPSTTSSPRYRTLALFGGVFVVALFIAFFLKRKHPLAP